MPSFVPVCPFFEADEIAVSNCESDSNCTGGSVCCTYGYNSICVQPTDIPYYDFTPLECPALSAVLGTCSSLCQLDSDCPFDQLCCSFGCARSCVAGVPSSRPCHALRERLSNAGEATYVPQCSSDGRFENVQYWHAKDHYWCVDPETGKPLGGAVRGEEPQCTSKSWVDVFVSCLSFIVCLRNKVL